MKKLILSFFIIIASHFPDSRINDLSYVIKAGVNYSFGKFYSTVEESISLSLDSHASSSLFFRGFWHIKSNITKIKCRCCSTL